MDPSKQQNPPENDSGPSGCLVELIFWIVDFLAGLLLIIVAVING
jgi:hypothetical protein